MKPTIALAGLAAAFLVMSASSADGAVDPLTQLPLPPAGAALSLYEKPDRVDDVPVCRSKGTMNLYTGRSGQVSAAVAWYAGHLPGFKHVHGMSSGRSQDTFYNGAGTLIVGITGKPGKEGEDTRVYSVVYGTIQPGASDKVIAGMNVQQVVCP